MSANKPNDQALAASGRATRLLAGMDVDALCRKPLLPVLRVIMVSFEERGQEKIIDKSNIIPDSAAPSISRGNGDDMKS